MSPKWEFCHDMFEGRGTWLEPSVAGFRVADPVKAMRYLPQESKEPDEEYLKRLGRSYFDRRFRTAIESFAGFLGSFSLVDVHPSIVAALQDIDLAGNSLEVFLHAADEKALIYEHCFILVEFPRRPVNEEADAIANNALAEKQMNLRPYLVLVDCRDVINWKLAPDNKTLVQVTIREMATVEDGRYGSKDVERYRVLRPGEFEIWEEREDEELFLVEQGEISLPQIPLVPYTVVPRDTNPFGGEPPLYDLAEMNLQHYQKCSDKDEIMRKCNLPVFVVNEATRSSPGLAKKDDSYRNISLGPNSCLWNVSASFVEPSGSALSATQSDIQSLEQAMDRRSLHFLSGNDFQRTATEIATFSAPVQANLGGMARAKQSAVQRCFEFWVAWMNAPGTGGGISVDDKILQSAIESAQTGQLFILREKGDLSRRSLLELLKRGKILPRDWDVDAEIAALAQEQADRNQQAVDMARQQASIQAGGGMG